MSTPCPQGHGEVLLHSEAAQMLFRGIKASSSDLQLNEFVKLLHQAQFEGRLSADEYSFLVEYVYGRRPKVTARGTSAIGVTGGLLVRRFVPRRAQRSPDRQKSRERRRTLGGSSALPPALRAHYSEGLRAVLCVVAEEIKQNCLCDFSIDKIAALAGVCRTTVQTALHEARRLGHISITERPQLGRKSLTNIVRIISAEWLTWISRGLGKPAWIGSKTAKMVNPTRKEDSLENERSRLSVPGNALIDAAAFRERRHPRGEKVLVASPFWQVSPIVV